jgi:hypothetical protein
MSMFASAHGVGIACEVCRRETFGSFRTYVELLRQRPGWTLSACPACRGHQDGQGSTSRFGRPRSA